MKLSIYNVIKHPHINEKKIFVWGSGSGYRRWKEKIEFHADAIIDNNKSMWGTYIDDLEIISPNTLRILDNNSVLIIIISYFYEEIKEQIISFGYDEDCIYTFKDIERTIFHDEKIKRQEEFLLKNSLSLKQFIEEIEYDLKEISYRNVYLLRVMMPYITLLSHSLFISGSNFNLFPPSVIREYYIYGEGPILVSYVWNKKRRPSLHNLIEKTVSEIPKELITELKPKSFYDGENDKSFITFKNNSVPLKFKSIIIKIQKIFSQKKYNLLEDEINWIINFAQYFLNMVDHYYYFFKENNFNVFVSGYANNAEENIKVQVAKNLGIKTLGLQHGTYGKIYEFNEVPYSHNHKYPTVDELLVWGDYSKEIMGEIKKDDSRVTVVGNPRYNLTTYERDQLKESKHQLIERNKFLVCFIGPGEREYSINQNMLKIADYIAEKYNIQYIVKMHPENKVVKNEFVYNKRNCNEFISDSRDINSLFIDVDFIITTGSTVIQEAVYQFIPVFVYDAYQAVSSICGNLSTVFKSIAQLDSIINKLLNENGFNTLINEYENFGYELFKNYNEKRPTTVYKDKVLYHLSKRYS